MHTVRAKIRPGRMKTKDPINQTICGVMSTPIDSLIKQKTKHDASNMNQFYVAFSNIKWQPKKVWMVRERMYAFGAENFCDERHDRLVASGSTSGPCKKIGRLPTQLSDHDATANVSYYHCLRTVIFGGVS